MKLISKLKMFIPNVWFNQMFNQPKVLLGRWNVDHRDPRSAEIINKKVDLSNEDHCGSCTNKKLRKVNIDIRKVIFFEII